jgi:hypothetical protein
VETASAEDIYDNDNQCGAPRESLSPSGKYRLVAAGPTSTEEARDAG